MAHSAARGAHRWRSAGRAGGRSGRVGKLCDTWTLEIGPHRAVAAGKPSARRSGLLLGPRAFIRSGAPPRGGRRLAAHAVVAAAIPHGRTGCPPTEAGGRAPRARPHARSWLSTGARVPMGKLKCSTVRPADCPPPSRKPWSLVPDTGRGVSRTIVGWIGIPCEPYPRQGGGSLVGGGRGGRAWILPEGG